jgi:ribosomal protein S25
MERIKEISLDDLKPSKRNWLRAKLRNKNFCKLCVIILKKISEKNYMISSIDVRTTLGISLTHALSLLKDMASVGFIYQEELNRKMYIYSPVKVNNKYLLSEHTDMILSYYDFFKEKEKGE